MGVMTALMNWPPVGRLLLKALKKRIFRPLEMPPARVAEAQEAMLQKKFERMKATTIGKKLDVGRVKFGEMPLTDYSFYQPFFESPSPDALMYPLEDYVRVRTSGTAGAPKWFLMPSEEVRKCFMETIIPGVLASFHDGRRITFEYGDTLYMNASPRPFASGFLASMGQRSRLMNIVPNMNLPYREKTEYFIRNYEKIDGALMMTPALISVIMPAIGKPIKLKAAYFLDSQIAEIYRREIEEFTEARPSSSYASSETFVSAIPSIESPLAFIFDWRRGLFEFTPLNAGKEEGKPVRLDQVKIGKTYRLIFTSFISELTRYAVNDCFECVSLGDSILNTDHPVFKFRSRLERTISLHNFTRISEDELLRAFKEAKIPYIDFTARVEQESGVEYLAVYLEARRRVSEKETMFILHEQLYRLDSDYRDLVDFFEYVPIKIHLMPRGSFAKYLEEKEGAVPKVDRINMRQEEFEKILRLMRD